jgi:hypothetical protein
MKVYDNIQIIDDCGWDLDFKIPEYDWELEKTNKKIPSDYGLGIKTIYKGNKYTFKRNLRKQPTVTLIITTWKGISGDAIHFYGKLQIDFPEMERDDKVGYTCSNRIPLFKNNAVRLTHIIEQWEIDKYPYNYEYYHAGDHHTGFYTVDAVKRRAQDF